MKSNDIKDKLKFQIEKLFWIQISFTRWRDRLWVGRCARRSCWWCRCCRCAASWKCVPEIQVNPKSLLKQYNRMIMFFCKSFIFRVRIFLCFTTLKGLILIKASLKIAIHRSLVMKKDCRFEISYKHVVNING